MNTDFEQQRREGAKVSLQEAGEVFVKCARHLRANAPRQCLLAGHWFDEMAHFDTWSKSDMQTIVNDRVGCKLFNRLVVRKFFAVNKAPLLMEEKMASASLAKRDEVHAFRRQTAKGFGFVRVVDDAFDGLFHGWKSDSKFLVYFAHRRVVAAFEFAGEQHFVFSAAVHLGGVRANDGNQFGCFGKLVPISCQHGSFATVPNFNGFFVVVFKRPGIDTALGALNSFAKIAGSGWAAPFSFAAAEGTWKKLQFCASGLFGLGVFANPSQQGFLFLSVHEWSMT